jgi:hypothetical protein
MIRLFGLSASLMLAAMKMYELAVQLVGAAS